MNKAVANVLNRVLGDWIKDLNSEQFNLSIFSGELCLENLQLKENILHRLGFPFDLLHGSVGKIKINIPWTSILSSSLSIEISDIYAYLTPKNPESWSEQYEKEAILAEKLSNLQKFESWANSDLGEASAPGYFEGYATKIVNNIQISIKNIYIRYEDTISSNNPFAVGLSLKKLTVKTCNKDWKPEYISECDVCYKLIEIVSFQCFCDYNVDIVKFRDKYNGDINTEFRRLAKDDITANIAHNYILRPFSMCLKLTVAIKPSPDSPQFIIDFHTKEISLDFYSGQIKLLLKFGEFMKLYNNFKAGVQRSIGETDFDDELEVKYIQMYSKMRKSQSGSIENQLYSKQLTQMEEHLKVDEIKKIRSKGITKLDVEEAVEKKQQEIEGIKNEGKGTLSKVSGFVSGYIWGSSEAEEKKKRGRKKS